MANAYKQSIDPEQARKFVRAVRAAAIEFRAHVKSVNPGLLSQLDAATYRNLEYLRSSLNENLDRGTTILGAAEALASFIEERPQNMRL
jgi:hypothetical protein